MKNKSDKHFTNKVYLW